MVLQAEGSGMGREHGMGNIYTFIFFNERMTVELRLIFILKQRKGKERSRIEYVNEKWAVYSEDHKI